LQGLEKFEEAGEFNKQNIACHNNSIRAHIIAMRNEVHNRRFDIVKEEANLADMYIAQLRKPEERDFVGSMFRNQMIDIMNQTNQLLERDEVFDYTDPTPLISKKFLPPLPQQILSTTASAAPDVELEEHRTDTDYDPKLTKAQNNARQIQKAMILAQKNEQDPNYPDHQKEWLKAAKRDKPFSSVSQVYSQPTAPQTITETEPESQLINWLTQRHDHFKVETESESQTIEEPQQTDWLQQQDSGWNSEKLEDYKGPTFEESWSEDPTIISQEIVQSPRSADRANSENYLRSKNSIGTISFQLPLVDTWKALTIHPHLILRKRMEDTINFWIQMTIWMKISCKSPMRTVQVMQMNQKPRNTEMSAPVVAASKIMKQKQNPKANKSIG
jgi:hypothetical protein